MGWIVVGFLFLVALFTVVPMLLDGVLGWLWAGGGLFVGLLLLGILSSGRSRRTQEFTNPGHRRAEYTPPKTFAEPSVQVRKKPKTTMAFEGKSIKEVSRKAATAIYDEPITDADVRRGICAVMNSGMNNDDQYEVLDSLYFQTVNNHPRGMAADVLDEISNAISQVQRRKAD